MLQIIFCFGFFSYLLRETSSEQSIRCKTQVLVAEFAASPMSTGRLRIIADRIDDKHIYYRYYSSYNLGGRQRAHASVRFGWVPRDESKKVDWNGSPCYVAETPCDVKGAGRPVSLLLDVTKLMTSKKK